MKVSDRAEHLEDGRLVETIRASRTRAAVEEAYERLVRKHWKGLTVLALQKLGDLREAEDVAQETFERAFRSLGRLNEPTAFLGWLLQIARNVATDHLRGRKSMLSIDAVSDAGAIGASRPGFVEEVETSEEFEQVLRLLDGLPERYREVITLKYLHGMDGRAMAQHLGEPEGTIRNRLFRALAKLRETLPQPPESVRADSD